MWIVQQHLPNSLQVVLPVSQSGRKYATNFNQNPRNLKHLQSGISLWWHELAFNVQSLILRYSSQVQEHNIAQNTMWGESEVSLFLLGQGEIQTKKDQMFQIWFQLRVKFSKLPHSGLLVHTLPKWLQLTVSDSAEATRGDTCYESMTFSCQQLSLGKLKGNKSISNAKQLEQSWLAYGRHAALKNWKSTPASDWLDSDDYEKLMQKVHNPKWGWGKSAKAQNHKQALK